MDELYFVPLESSETSKIIIDSLYCSSPRKSLVKGERFIRGEEKPELINSLTDQKSISMWKMARLLGVVRLFTHC